MAKRKDNQHNPGLHATVRRARRMYSDLEHLLAQHKTEEASGLEGELPVNIRMARKRWMETQLKADGLLWRSYFDRRPYRYGVATV
jgi:hypothetical protein